MLHKSLLSSKLEDIIFLNVKASAVNDIFKSNVVESVYLPLKVGKIVDGITINKSFEEIPIKDIVEAMCYVLGCDEQFKYSQIYKDILLATDWCLTMIKSSIAAHIKAEKYLDGYLFLRGLYMLESTEDIYDKLLWCIYNDYLKDKGNEEELKNVITYGKDVRFKSAFFYYSLLLNEQGEYTDALDALNVYLSLGGEKQAELHEYYNGLKILSDIQKGKDNMQSNPRYALEVLLPLLDTVEDDAFLYYYISVAYRNLGLYHKAIYYLNDAQRIDNTLLNVFNEMGLNYACLENYDTAINYFRKAFEVTKSVEICTNLIMCYIKKGDLKQAKLHMEIAKKLDKNDSVLMDIEKLLGESGAKNGN